MYISRYWNWSKIILVIIETKLFKRGKMNGIILYQNQSHEISGIFPKIIFVKKYCVNSFYVKINRWSHEIFHSVLHIMLKNCERSRWEWNSLIHLIIFAWFNGKSFLSISPISYFADLWTTLSTRIIFLCL